MDVTPTRPKKVTRFPVKSKVSGIVEWFKEWCAAWMLQSSLKTIENELNLL